MNWNIGHILVYRERYLGVLDAVSAADSNEFAIYGAGSEPLTDSARAIPLDTLIERLDESVVRLKTVFQSLSPEKLEEPRESHADEFRRHQVSGGPIRLLGYFIFSARFGYHNPRWLQTPIA